MGEFFRQIFQSEFWIKFVNFLLAVDHVIVSSLIIAVWVAVCIFHITRLKNSINTRILKRIINFIREAKDKESQEKEFVSTLCSHKNDVAMVFYFYAKTHNNFDEAQTFVNHKFYKKIDKRKKHGIFYLMMLLMVVCIGWTAWRCSLNYNFDQQFNIKQFSWAFSLALSFSVLFLFFLIFTMYKVDLYWRQFKNMFKEANMIIVEFLEKQNFDTFVQELLGEISVSHEGRVERLITKMTGQKKEKAPKLKQKAEKFNEELTEQAADETAPAGMLSPDGTPAGAPAFTPAFKKGSVVAPMISPPPIPMVSPMAIPAGSGSQIIIYGSGSPSSPSSSPHDNFLKILEIQILQQMSSNMSQENSRQNQLHMQHTINNQLISRNLMAQSFAIQRLGQSVLPALPIMPSFQAGSRMMPGMPMLLRPPGSPFAPITPAVNPAITPFGEKPLPGPGAPEPTAEPAAGASPAMSSAPKAAPPAPVVDEKAEALKRKNALLAKEVENAFGVINKEFKKRTFKAGFASKKPDDEQAEIIILKPDRAQTKLEGRLESILNAKVYRYDEKEWKRMVASYTAPPPKAASEKPVLKTVRKPLAKKVKKEEKPEVKEKPVKKEPPEVKEKPVKKEPPEVKEKPVKKEPEVKEKPVEKVIEKSPPPEEPVLSTADLLSMNSPAALSADEIAINEQDLSSTMSEDIPDEATEVKPESTGEETPADEPSEPNDEPKASGQS